MSEKSTMVRFTNLITNGDFETNITGWDDAGSDAVLTRETVFVIRGAGSLKAVEAELGAGLGVQTPIDTDPGITVVPNQIIFMSALVMGDGAIVFQVYFNDVDLWAVTTGVASNDAAYLSGIAVVPPGASTVRFRVGSFYDDPDNDPAANLTIDLVRAVALGTFA